jgi:large subunit ribosomal protein L22
MEAIAKARFQRISPRKARVVVNMIRGKNVATAIDQLRFTQKAAAKIISKVLDSAIANAKEKDAGVDLDALVVKTAFVDQAPNQHMRRYRPRAMGRATRIVKGMSHITIVVGEED